MVKELNNKQGYSQIFEKHFSQYKHQRIAIYGTGVNAERILTGASGYDIRCMISLDKIGELFFGYPIKTLDEALSDCDVIIIAATLKVRTIIFERIKEAVPSEIKILDMQGNDLRIAQDFSQNPYWNKTEEELKKAINEHEVISFDLFDTLVIRQTLNVTIFHQYLQELLKKEKEIPFVQWRNEAEEIALKKTPSPTLKQIYDEFRIISGVDEKTCDYIREFEFQKELELLTPRVLIRDLYIEAINRGKRVFIISDTYYEKDQIKKILETHGFPMPDRMLLSCEEHATKGQGDLYKLVDSNAKEAGMLHVGDNYTTDFEMSQLFGMEAFYIANPEDLLRMSALSAIMLQTKSIWDKILLGSLSTIACNNPFSFSKHRGKIDLESENEIGRLCVAPVVMSFLSFLVSHTANKNAEILFCARDGAFPYDIYQNIVKKKYNKLPDAHYFYTSRAAMCKATVMSLQDLKVYLSKVDGDYNVPKFFAERFGVDLPGSLNGSFSDLQNKYGTDWINACFSGSFDECFAPQKPRLKNLKKYYHSLTLDEKKQVVLVDLVTRGTCLYGMRKVTESPVELVAYGGIEIPNAYADDEDACCLYGNDSTGTLFYQWFTILEILLGSQEAQCGGYDGDGTPVFVDKTEYCNKLVSNVQHAMTGFIETYIDQDWVMHPVSPEFAEALLNLLDRSYSYIPEELIDEFEVRDPLWNPGSDQEQTNVLRQIR